MKIDCEMYRITLIETTEPVLTFEELESHTISGQLQEWLLCRGLLIWRYSSQYKLFSPIAVQNWYLDSKCAKLLKGHCRPNTAAADLGRLRWEHGEQISETIVCLLTEQNGDSPMETDTPTDSADKDKTV